jgi:hypothetical protein
MHALFLWSEVFPAGVICGSIFVTFALALWITVDQKWRVDVQLKW